METTSEDKSPAGQETIPEHTAELFTLADILEDELAGKIHERKKDRETGDAAARLKALHKILHDEKRSALCLSGGGIRSATFGLGVLQALARRDPRTENDPSATKDLLTSFDYLSTVSGGGYIGAWLSAWIANNKGDMDAVARELKKDLTKSSDAKRDPESEPIRHLRRYSNYLTPKLGFFSSDTWTLIATVLRNIFLNWLMLIPIIATVLMIPRVYAGAALGEASSWGKAIGLLVVGLICMVVATTYSALDLPTYQDQMGRDKEKQRKATAGKFGMFCLSGLVLSALFISLGWFWLLGNFPTEANKLRVWKFPFGAWLFVGGLWAGSLLGGLAAIVWLKLPFLQRLKEGLPMLITALVGGAALWWVLTWVFGDLTPYLNDAVAINYLCFAPSLVLLVFLLMNFIYVVTFSRWTTTEDREWWARSAGWMLITALAWAALSAITLWGPIALQTLRYDQAWVKSLVTLFGGTAGIATALLGFSAKTAAKKREGAGGTSWLAVGAVVFLLFLLVYVAISTSWLLAKFLHVPTERPEGDIIDYRAFYSTIVLQAKWWQLLAVALGFALVSLIVGTVVNVNQFSLHAMYNSRLTRAYLGASRPSQNPRKPHWFTGFDPEDKIKMHELTRRTSRKLFHVVNTALNLVGGTELAWQERMARSFTISPLHCGNWNLGYRDSRRYYDGIELGTAITVSGAAANPNMGYHSSPLVSILMTLFNVRLGWWAGNPGEAGAHTWDRKGPRHAALPLVAEALGNTTDDFRDVNLSDGGHFENLGLYEMVLRRCQRIVVIDAGRDTKNVFEDLGNAIRKIRIDFGIRIELVLNVLEPQEKDPPLARFAVGQIRYDEVDEGAPIGKLIYIKPLLRRNEPVDIRNYAAANPGFPHESTSDQWFSESQLESYRMLGFHTIDEILRDGPAAPTMDQFFDYVEKQAAEINDSSKKENIPSPSLHGSLAADHTLPKP